MVRLVHPRGIADVTLRQNRLRVQPIYSLLTVAENSSFSKLVFNYLLDKGLRLALDHLSLAIYMLCIIYAFPVGIYADGEASEKLAI